MHARFHAHAHPPTAPTQAQPAGVEQPNIHAGLCFARPHLAGASATRCADWAERSDGPCGCPHPGFPSGCAEERSGQRIRDRDCLSATQCSEFERDPAGCEHRRLPAAKRRDAACRVAFSLVTFSWRRKRKLLACRGDNPASALRSPAKARHAHSATSPSKQKNQPPKASTRRPNRRTPAVAVAPKTTSAHR